MERIRKYLLISKSLLRTPTYLLLIMYLFIGFLTGLIVNGPNELLFSYKNAYELLICSLIIAFWYIAGSGLNDYADYEIDRINLKNDKSRPLVRGQLNKATLAKLVLVFSLSAAILSAILSVQQLLLTLALLLLNAAYSLPPLQISRRGALAPLLLPLGYIILPFYSGYMLTSNAYFLTITLTLVAAYYLHFMGRIILKDYRDVKGDKQYGKLTFLLKHGNTAVCITSGLLVASSTILILLALKPYIQIFQFGIICLLFFGLTNLYQLSQTSEWRNQKPILAAFGRTMTGITALTIISLLHALKTFTTISQIILVVCVSAIYIWSAQKAYNYNKLPH